MELDEDSLNSINGYLQLLHGKIQELNSHDKRTGFWLGNIPSRDSISDTELHIALFLIHPLFHERADGSRIDGLQGSRNFSSKQKEAVMDNRCKISDVIDGAVCESQHTVADHAWPYSLGGPTRGNNLVELCNSCNRRKSDSIILFNWKRGTTEIAWLEELLVILFEVKSAHFD